MQARITTPSEYDAFRPVENAKLSLLFLTRMTDAAYGHLPYSLFAPMHDTPFAEHGRRDDAEMVASWYEGISCAREILATDDGADVEKALRKLLLEEGWDEASGLRFPVSRPWSGTLEYTLIAETAIILSALNRMVECDRNDALAERRAKSLVRGLRKCATERNYRALSHGEVPLGYPCYSFESDVIVKGKGFDLSVSTGFSDATLRYSALIDPLTQRHILTGDSVALNLAIGIANRIVMLSRFFSVRTEFIGSTYAALTTATGLVRLGVITDNERYTQTAKGIYDFVRRHTSAFGWVPEYIDWQLPSEDRCSGCGVGAMIKCAAELADNGYPEYLDDIHRFWRNHLEESQLTDTSFLPKSPVQQHDTERRTWREIPRRFLGAASGGTAVNYLQFTRSAAISPCCSAALPQAMLTAWRRTAVSTPSDGILINFPVNYETDKIKVTVGYPNEGYVRAEIKKAAKIVFRVYGWMGPVLEGKINGRPALFERHDDFVSFGEQPADTVAELSHVLKVRRVMENVMGMDFFGVWRGPDMVDLLPRGFPVRLYQRVAGQAPEVPDNFASTRSRGDLVPLPDPPGFKDKKISNRKPMKGKSWADDKA